MKKTMLVLAALAVAMLLAACAPQVPRVEIGNAKVLVEIADDSAERMKGLMNRDHLDKNAGLLFLFEDEMLLGFWMKDTLIPLDMIFIDKGYRIVNIETALPCEKEPCQTYGSKGRAQYVLEVNAGFAEKNGINVGDDVEFFLEP